LTPTTPLCHSEFPTNTSRSAFTLAARLKTLGENKHYDLYIISEDLPKKFKYALRKGTKMKKKKYTILVVCFPKPTQHYALFLGEC